MYSEMNALCLYLTLYTVHLYFAEDVNAPVLSVLCIVTLLVALIHMHLFALVNNANLIYS